MSTGVDPTASDADIKKAYHRMARAYHPDKNSRPHSASVFHVVQHAYDVIGNAEGRLRYDTVRAGGAPQPPMRRPPTPQSTDHSGRTSPAPQHSQQQQQQQQQQHAYYAPHTPEYSNGRASAPPATEAPAYQAPVLPPVRKEGLFEIFRPFRHPLPHRLRCCRCFT